MDKVYKCIIFDCDGTLVATKSGATFRKTADDWQWMPGRVEKLQQLDRQGKKLAVATNQGGVAFGFLDYHEMRRELARMAEEGCIVYTAMCFTHPQARIEEFRMDSERRKPGPGMLLEAVKASGETLADTLMVGDRDEDEQSAKNAGCDFMWADEFFQSASQADGSSTDIKSMG